MNDIQWNHWNGLRPVYTCDVWCNFCRSLQCNFCRKCKLAAILLPFQCDICCIFPQIAAKLHQVLNMFETSAISRRQIALKSPLVYTCNFYREPESDKNCTEKCDQNCTKNRMCKQAFTNIQRNQTIEKIYLERNNPPFPSN